VCKVVEESINNRLVWSLTEWVLEMLYKKLCNLSKYYFEAKSTIDSRWMYNLYKKNQFLVKTISSNPKKVKSYPHQKSPKIKQK